MISDSFVKCFNKLSRSDPITSDKYNFDEVISREGTHSVKWEFIPPVEGKSNTELLPLWVADMDFPCAEPILEALHERVERKIFGYSNARSEGYLTAVQAWFQNRHQWHFELEDIHLSPGVVPALAILIKSLTNPGDGIIIQKPVYYPFMILIENNDRRIMNNALIEKDGFYTMDFADLEEKARQPNTTMMVLCSPHNPVGRVWREDELRRLAKICLENDVTIISDEIHCDLIRENSLHIPLGKIISDERIVTCTAASKSFNLAGLQTSNIIIRSEEIRQKWTTELMRKSGFFGTNPMGIVATEAAYTKGAFWLDQVNRYIDDNFEYVRGFITENLNEARYVIPEGTYFAWIDFRAYGFSAKKLEEMVQRNAGVVLDEGYIFGDEGAGFERINVACPRSILRECLVRIYDVMNAGKSI